MTLKNSPSDIVDAVCAHRRLAVLRLLSVLAGRANEFVLRDLLNQLGVVSSHGDVRDCLRFLDERGTVKVGYQDALMVVDLTQQGDDIARGRLTLDGVATPGPDCPYPTPP